MTSGRIPGTTMGFVPINPLPITRQLLDRGQQRYQINCVPCHGPRGTEGNHQQIRHDLDGQFSLPEAHQHG